MLSDYRGSDPLPPQTAPSADVLDVLLDHGLIEPEVVVNRDVVAIDASRRNRNTRVLRADGTGFFVKQIRYREPQAEESLLREARVYWLAQNDPDFGDLKDLQPEYLGYDATRRALVMRILPGLSSLAESVRSGGALDPDVLGKIGHALAQCHARVGTRTLLSRVSTVFPRATPWIMSAHQLNGAGLSAPSAGCAQLLQLLRDRAEFQRGLDAAGGQWDVSAFIHGDIKWDNLALSATAQREVRIVDWELADFGDPGWDVGAILQAFAVQWLAALPPQQVSAEQISMWAPMYMQSLLRPLAAFWKTYTDTRELAESARALLLRRSVRYAGARLVLAAYEMVYAAPQITPPAMHLLNASLLLMTAPERVAGSWFPLN